MTDRSRTDSAARGRVSISRRTVLGSAVSATSLALIPLRPSPVNAAQAVPRVLSDTAWRTLVAFTGRLIPADDDGPGAVEAGAADYINLSLSEWNSEERPALEAGLEALNDRARESDGSDFADLDAARQDALMTAMEAGDTGGAGDAAQVFSRLHRLTLEGMFSDPYYGGNRNYIGWDLIGYPGAVLARTPAMQRMGRRLPPLHTSAYGGDYDGE